MILLRDEFLSLCLNHAEGLRDEQLRKHFAERYLQLVPIINSCLAENRIRCMKTERNELVYQAMDPNLAEKMKNLGAEQLLVYQVVEKAGNKGIWHKDIRSQTSLQQPALKKILKNLESRQLIKSTSSISSKTRKLYLLFDLEPAKEITGGPWYTEHEFDHEFIEELSRAIYMFIKQQRKPPSLAAISDYVRTSGVSKVELAAEEVQLIINSLAYDMKIEPVRSGVLGALHTPDGGPCYKVSRHVTPLNHFTDFPCGRCPVQAQCEEGGEISPAACRYFNRWLELKDGGGGGGGTVGGGMIEF